jgi:hypothetical protein
MLVGRLLKAADSKNPMAQVAQSAGGDTVRKSFCFPFITAPVKDKGCQGCDGTMAHPKKKRGQRVTCDRVHVEMDDPAWANADKATLAELWDFVQRPAVAEVWEPTSFFRSKME